jgi:hypothetical protein
VKLTTSPSSAEVKECVELYFHSRYVIMVWCLVKYRNNFLSTVHITLNPKQRRLPVILYSKFRELFSEGAVRDSHQWLICSMVAHSSTYKEVLGSYSGEIYFELGFSWIIFVYQWKLHTYY